MALKLRRCVLAIVRVAIAIAVTLGIVPRVHAADPIRLWHAYRGAEEEALTEIVRDHDATVELLAVPYDAFSAKLQAAVTHGEGPHLFIDAHERLGDYRSRGMLASPGALDPEVFAPAAIEAATIEGQAWGIPLSLKSVALYLNDDLVPVDPPTLEALIARQAELPTGVFALAYEANNAYGHAPILHAFGGRMLDDRDGFGFVGPEAEASVAFARELVESGAVPRDADGALVSDLFRSGRAAAAISGPWLATDVGTAVRYRVVPLPVLAATGRPLAPLLTVECLMLSPRGGERSDVADLARHLASAEAAAIRSARTGIVSARRDVPAPTDARIAAFARQAELAIPMPSSTAMRSAWEPANKALRKVLRGEADPATALAEAQRRFDLVRRPAPPPASPWPVTVVLGIVAAWGAVALWQRRREPDLRARLRRSRPAYAWVAHAVIAVGVLVVLPLFVGALTAFFAGPPGNTHYVGLANFVDILGARGGPLFASGSFWLVLAVTVLWTVVNVTGHVVLGVGLGILLARPLLRLRPLYRVLLIIPWAVPNYVTALAWKGMFHRQFGAITAILESLGAEPISWFSRFSTAFAANVATNVWLGFPFMMVVTLGALTAIPRDVLEAAEVDGASRWQRLRHVTLPMIRPSLLPAVTLGAIWTFNMFNVVFLVSGGDPDGTTDILVSEAYRWAFTREAQYGYAAAYAVLIFGLLALAGRAAGWIERRSAR